MHQNHNVVKDDSLLVLDISFNIPSLPYSDKGMIQPPSKGSLQLSKQWFGQYFSSSRLSTRSKDFLSPFIINKLFVGSGRQIKSIRKILNEALFVEAMNEMWTFCSLRPLCFFNQIPEVMQLYEKLSSSKGVVFSHEILDCFEEEILQELENMCN